MFYLYIKRENIGIYGCKWRRICPQPTGPCHSARLQSPTQPQSPDIPIPIRITHFFLGSCIAHLCAPRPHHCSDRSSASLLDRLTTATFSFYTCIVSVLSIAAIFLNCEQCFIAAIHMHTDVGMLAAFWTWPQTELAPISSFFESKSNRKYKFFYLL